MIPTIPIDVFKAAYELQKEGRMVINQGEISIMASGIHNARQLTEEELAAKFNLLNLGINNDAEDVEYADWNSYKQLKMEFHVIKPSTAWPG
jgi:hypothetical protein